MIIAVLVSLELAWTQIERTDVDFEFSLLSLGEETQRRTEGIWN
jgi:hypothetical protein